MTNQTTREYIATINGRIDNMIRIWLWCFGVQCVHFKYILPGVWSPNPVTVYNWEHDTYRVARAKVARMYWLGTSGQRTYIK